MRRPGESENMLTNAYRGLWSKYRPAILKMMVDAGEVAQTYQLSSHEFYTFNGHKKVACNFVLEVAHGKVVSGVKDSAVAQGLWDILQLSQKANELTSTAIYHFSMDKKFLLRIQKGIDKQ